MSVDDEQFMLVPSHVPYDSIAELAAALNKILEGYSEAVVRWNEGPAFPNTRDGSVDAEDEGFETRLNSPGVLLVRPEQKFNYVFKHFWYKAPRPRFGAQPASGVGSVAARLHSC